MSAQHTPGPWTHSKYGLSIKAPSDYLEFTLVAVLTTARKTAHEVEANACLIAAAPDLLEALQAFPGFTDDAAAGDLWLEKMRAAVAKATGEAA